MNIVRFIFLTFFLSFVSLCQGQMLYECENGVVRFTSDAPLELIKAESPLLKGVLDLNTQEFAFKIDIKSFEGFNSPLQRIHFFENYMEVDKFSGAIFQGIILEKINISQERQIVRAKGEFTVHGVTREIIIKVKLGFTSSQIQFDSDFILELEQYDIDIPKIVRQKIAEKINVKVTGVLLN